MRRSHIRGIALLAAGVGALLGRALVTRLGRYDLRDKVVLITGGGRGLGLALARAFGAAGARLFLVGREQGTLDAAFARLRAAGHTVDGCVGDVGDPAQVARAVARAQEAYGRVDVLVNNAGTIQVGPLDSFTHADWAEAMSTHFWGPLHAIEAVLPQMRARGEGRIVNVSSIGGILAAPHLLPYDASKFALRGLSEGMRIELAKDGIAVTTVCPGLMRTGSPRNARFKGRHREEYAWFVLGDSLPFTSMSADRAARAIVRACASGRAHLVLSWQAKLAAVMHGLFPGLVADALAVVDRLLPAAGGIGVESATGAESASPLTESWWTALDDRAARRNNETLPSFLDRPSHPGSA